MSASDAVLTVQPTRRDVDTAERTKYRIYFITGLFTVLVPLAGTAYGGYLLFQEGISWLNLSLMVAMYVPTILGIELGYHRYLAHHSLKTTPKVTSALAVLGSMAGHGPPIWWIAVHRRHHQNSDHPGDPHSPNLHGETLWESIKGGWHAHIGWMFKPEHTDSQAALYARDLLRDRRIHAIDSLYLLWMALGLIVPAVIGGIVTLSAWDAWTGFVWGGLVRLFFGQHALWWGIVTLCHRWGTRPFESGDDSTNSLLVAIMMLGDGWHNNHHAFPASAKVGLLRGQVDPTWWAIVALRRLGLAWDIRVPSAAAIEAKRIRQPA